MPELSDGCFCHESFIHFADILGVGISDTADQEKILYVGGLVQDLVLHIRAISPRNTFQTKYELNPFAILVVKKKRE